MTPFPPCSQTTWGVRETAARYGLEPMQRGAIFRTTDGGHSELRLGMRGDRELRFTTKLTAYGGKDARFARTIDGAVMSRVVGDVATFSFRFVSTQLAIFRDFIHKVHEYFSDFSVVVGFYIFIP